jgi:L-ribulose-5-phosphate 3-epimerase
MRKTICQLLCILLFAFGTSQLVAQASGKSPWNLGVGLFTFHTMSFLEALDKIDSAGLKYIEPNDFQRAGPGFGDSTIAQLSPAGIEKLKAIISQRGFVMESIYIGGAPNIAAWKRLFDMSKQLGVKFITTEPPIDMWDSIDSLAGLAGIKVAIHEHWKGVSRYWSPDTVLAAIKGHPNFGACADLGHWPKSGIDPVEGVKKLSGHILAIHLKDCAEYNNIKIQDVTAGTGVVNFPAVFAELKKQHFTGNIYIERDATDPQGNLASVIQGAKYYYEQTAKLK